jgi:hypothetical protein
LALGISEYFPSGNSTRRYPSGVYGMGMLTVYNNELFRGWVDG